MTLYRGKTVDWILYPDLILPNEAAVNITLPRSVVLAREREAFVQAQRRSFKQSDHRIARQALDSMLALLNPPASARERVRKPKKDVYLSPGGK